MQLASSERSEQSITESQRFSLAMHTPSEHWNSSVKEKALYIKCNQSLIKKTLLDFKSKFLLFK